MSALVFAAVSAVIVTVAPSPASATCGRYSARELTDLYRELPDGDERRQVADAIDDRSHELLAWLHDEEDFQQRLAGPRHCLTEQHKAWLAHVRAEIDAAISALDPNSAATT